MEAEIPNSRSIAARPRIGSFGRSGLALSALLFAVTACAPRSQIAVPPPAASARDPGTLPFEQPLDAELEQRAPELFAELSEMDRRGDGDGVFTRGDAMAAGQPQLFGDLHAHPFMEYGASPFFRGLPSSSRTPVAPWDVVAPQITFAGLRRGAVSLLFSFAYAPSIWPACAKGTEGKLGEILCQLRKTREFCELHGERMAIARTADEARSIARSGKVAVVLGVEGADAIERLEDLETLWQAGVRIVTLTHFVDNQVAGAAASTLWRFEDPNFLTPGEPTPDGYPRNPVGLSPFGVQVVRRMAELGILIDLEHSSDLAVRDVLAATEDLAAAVLFTHTGMRAIHPSELNVSDETIRKVAARGGLVGIITLRTLLTAEGLEECHAFQAHFRHLLEIAGPEHVAIGSDFNSFSPRPSPCRSGGAGFASTGIRSIGDFPGLLQSLVEEGVPPKALEQMGENMLRVLALAQERAAHPTSHGGAAGEPSQ
jgi:microsomal dipeptidase-like Zn-dependent dipeptidase